MEYLKKPKLPSNLIQVRSLSDVLEKAVHERLLALSRLDAVPRASQAMGLLTSKLNLSNLEELKKSLILVRRIADLTSKFMKANLATKVDRHQLQPSQIQTVLEALAPQLGYNGLPDQDEIISTAVVLVLSVEGVATTQWTLTRLPSESDNLIIQLTNLYKTFQSSVSPTIKYEPGNPAINVPPSVTTNENYGMYMMQDDDVVTTSLLELMALNSVETGAVASALAASLASMPDEPTRVAAIASKQQLLSNHLVIQQLADLRLIDHIFSLLMTPKVWDSFLPARTITDVSAALDRANTLADLAGYCQSLLNLPFFLKTGIYMETYASVVKWQGTSYALSGTLLTDIENFITDYDVLSTIPDARDLFTVFSDKVAGIPDSSVTSIYKEIINIVASGKLDSSIKNASPIILKTSDLQQFRDADYMKILTNAPADKVALLFNLEQHLNTTFRYVSVMKDLTVTSRSKAYPYLSNRVMASLMALNLRPVFKWCSNIHPGVNVLEHGPRMLSNVIGVNESTLNISATELNAIRSTELFTIQTAANYVQNYGKVRWLFDTYTAANLRKDIGFDYRSWMPGELSAPGAMLYLDTIVRDYDIMNSIFEHVMSSSKNTIAHQLQSEIMQTTFATYICSFALFFIKEKGSDTLIPVNPAGKPWGISMTELSALNPVSPKSSSFVKRAHPILLERNATDDEKAECKFWVRFIDKLPIPTTDLTLTKFSSFHSYYQFKGRTSTKPVEVTTLVRSEGLLHYAGLPPYPLRDVSADNVFFDKIYSYKPAALLIQMDPIYSPQESTSTDTFVSVPTEVGWEGEQYDATLRFLRYGTYVPVDGSVQTPQSELTDLLKELHSTEKKITKEGAQAATETTSVGSMEKKISGEADHTVKFVSDGALPNSRANDDYDSKSKNKGRNKNRRDKKSPDQAAAALKKSDDEKRDELERKD